MGPERRPVVSFHAQPQLRQQGGGGGRRGCPSMYRLKSKVSILARSGESAAGVGRGSGEPCPDAAACPAAAADWAPCWKPGKRARKK